MEFIAKNLWVLVLVLINCQDNAQQKSIMDKKDNPYYSRTDTAHLQVSNTEWKKILPHNLSKIFPWKD